MRIISRRVLKDFAANHPDAESALCAWVFEAKSANWRSPADVKAKYKNASIIADNRVVFNICGNKYRLIVKFNYSALIGYIRFLGTHAEYDKVNSERI